MQISNVRLVSNEPYLVLNNSSSGTRIATHIQRELRTCDSFRFYVAFLTQDGIAILFQTLLELQKKRIKGQILVSQYLNFTDPLALKTLLKFSNIHARIMTEGSMHSKGYFFVRTKEKSERYIIGSSNWTASALCKNIELNIHLETPAESRLALQVKEEFNLQFERATRLSDEVIKSYSLVYNASKQPFECSLENETGINKAQFKQTQLLMPNRMQLSALNSLTKLRKDGKFKALIISATGTGKTYLSAFDVKALQAKRMLFVVHRENIARAAMSSFKKVFGESKTLGMYSGSDQEPEADFVFATVQTLSREKNLLRFKRNTFDYIIVDESHRTGAASYARFLDHFKPGFLLGMTATPERSDGADILSYFDHNIAYEIRLQAALQEEMLCPFHYFGVTDLIINGEEVKDDSDFNRLIKNERVNRIIEKAKLYGCDDGIVRGLVFCSRVDEAHALSREFNKRGFKTLALDGDTPEEIREEAILRLESASNALDKIDYLFTVDIFNEGVDIPQCNQIILLRPTQSSIIFVQQLGRGLRRVETKEKYLTVIDFIGNYKNNYLIPIALWGDRSYDKDRLRRLLVSGSDCLPGTSTINFDEISREKIFASINSANMQLFRDLQQDFVSLQTRLGKIPLMVDFLDHDLRDPSSFANYSKSFYAFSKKMAPEAIPQISKTANCILEGLWRDSFTGTSLEEPLLLLNLLGSPSVKRVSFQKKYKDLTGCSMAQGRWESAASSLNLQFMQENVKGKLVTFAAKYGIHLLEINENCIKRTSQFEELISNNTFKTYLSDLALYAQKTFLLDFDPKKYVKGFVRNRKYRRSDVFRILGASLNPNPQTVGGYLISTNKKWCPLFITYKKESNISSSIRYEDCFIDQNSMDYFSKNNRSMNSPDVRYFYNLNDKQRMLLFVQKSNDEGIAFYYLGDVHPDPKTFREEFMADKKTSVVRMKLNLVSPVDEDLYEYITQ